MNERKKERKMGRKGRKKEFIMRERRMRKREGKGEDRQRENRQRNRGRKEYTGANKGTTSF